MLEAAKAGADRTQLRELGLQLGVEHGQVAMLVEKAIREAQQSGARPAPQPMQAQPGAPATHPPVKVGSMNVRAWGGIALGIVGILFGVIATITSYESAGPGESYSIWWGPALVGVIFLVQGVYSLLKSD